VDQRYVAEVVMLAGSGAGPDESPVEIYRKNYIISSVESFGLAAALHRLGELLRDPVLVMELYLQQEEVP
jgi:hypothetical protein